MLCIPPDTLHIVFDKKCRIKTFSKSIRGLQQDHGESRLRIYFGAQKFEINAIGFSYLFFMKLWVYAYK